MIPPVSVASRVARPDRQRKRPRRLLVGAASSQCEEGDLNPQKDAEVKGESTSGNRQEPPSTSTNCAPGGTISKKSKKR